MISKEYLAGLLDGDGCITAFLKKLKTSPHGYAAKGRVKVTNKSTRLLTAVQQRFGGKMEDRGDGVHDLCWESFHEIERLLTQIMPHLIEKRGQARYMMDLARLRRTRDFCRKTMLIKLIQNLNSGLTLPDGV